MKTIFSRKKGLVYDWMDFILSLVFLGIGIFIAFLLITANRMNTVDTKYELVERVEIMDHATYFMNVPLSHIDINDRELSASQRAYLQKAQEEGLLVYDLFSRRMIHNEAQTLLTKAIEKNPIFSKYKITLSAIQSEKTYNFEHEEFRNDIQNGEIIKTALPYTQVTDQDRSFETDIRCGLDQSIKEIAFNLPLPLHKRHETQTLTIQYCHTVRYFERE